MGSLAVILLVGAVLGLVLGMLGGGGGILAVPMLIAIGEPVLEASTMSLVIVGVGAASALIPHARAGRVEWRLGLLFGALGSVGALVGARIAPLLPPAVILGGLVVLLIIGSFVMLRNARITRKVARGELTSADLPVDDRSILDQSRAAPVGITSWPLTILLATAVGLVTGVFGVGAGFVVVPALTTAMRLPMRRAAATALVVIVLNSAVALLARHEHLGPPGLTLGLAVATGAFAALGALVSHRVPAWVLSTAFGSLMLIVAAYTLRTVVMMG